MPGSTPPTSQLELAHLDDGNDRAILVQGHEGPAQIVRLGHRGTPSIDVSDEIAILAARPIASLCWRGLDSNFSYAGAGKPVVAPFEAPSCLGRVGSRPSDPATAIGAPRADTNRGFRVGRSIFDAKRHVGVFVADSKGSVDNRHAGHAQRHSTSGRRPQRCAWLTLVGLFL